MNSFSEIPVEYHALTFFLILEEIFNSTEQSKERTMEERTVKNFPLNNIPSTQHSVDDVPSVHRTLGQKFRKTHFLENDINKLSHRILYHCYSLECNISSIEILGPKVKQ